MYPNDKYIPVLRPLLPEHKAIVPYLKDIDKSRWYSNFGPLVLHLEERFEEFYNVKRGGVVTLSSGAAGLTNALRALNLPHDSYCIVPSWTFVAVPAAAVAAGLRPYFIDVDYDSWAIDPETTKEYIKNIKGKVSAVIAVAPFGNPMVTEEWDAFTEETGIPVIIDGASCFDTVAKTRKFRPGKTPIMVSLHATKVMGVGEGGLVISKNIELVDKIKQMSNFGFSGVRKVFVPGTNGKMSEYTAAVAHAGLDNWSEKRAKWRKMTDYYMEALIDTTFYHKLSFDWVTSTCSVMLPNENAEEMVLAMKEKNIETRRWWGDGCHTLNAYKDFPSFPLPVTEKLAKSLLGLPFSVDMTKKDVNYIVKTLAHAYKQPIVRRVMQMQ